MNKRLVLILLAALFCAAGGTGIWYWIDSRPDPQIVKAEALSNKIFDGTSGPPDLTKPEVREQFDELRKEVEAMPEEKREEFVSGQREKMQTHMETQFDRYLAMNEEERVAELDRVIDSMEKMRQMFQERRRERGSADGSGGPPAGGPPGAGPPGGGPPGGGPPGGPRRGMDAERRSEMHRQMLDATTPEFRAKASEFARDLFKRMQERGIEPPFPMPPF
jgi:hypothetical protein